MVVACLSLPRQLIRLSLSLCLLPVVLFSCNILAPPTRLQVCQPTHFGLFPQSLKFNQRGSRQENGSPRLMVMKASTTRTSGPPSVILKSNLPFLQKKMLLPRMRLLRKEKRSSCKPKWSSFHTLTSCEQIAFMDKLLENGYDIDAIDEDGFTTLHTAVVVKKEAVVMHLLRAGANPHVRDRLSMKMTPSSLDGATLLHFAVQVGSLKLVKLLLKYKVDVNLADDEGWTPLHVALQSRCRDIAKILLVNGADKTRRTKNGKTPLDLSLCFGKDFKSYDLAKLLKLVPAGMDF